MRVRPGPVGTDDLARAPSRSGRSPGSDLPALDAEPGARSTGRRRTRRLHAGPFGRGGGRRAAWRRRQARRVLAAVLAGAAVLVAVRVLAPPAPASRTVVVAAHDVPAGATLAPGDLETRRYASSLVPDSTDLTVPALAGRVAAGPLRAGEIVTESRLVGPSLLDGLPAGTVAVQVSTSTLESVVRPGRRVDAYVVGNAQPAASAALVLAVLPGGEASAFGEARHTTVVLAVPEGSVGRLVPVAGSGSPASAEVSLAVR